MPERGYQIRNQYNIHFITFAVVEWVDVFTRTPVRSLKHRLGVRDYGLLNKI